MTSVPLPEAFRGEVWDVDLDDFGEHPVVVVSRSVVNTRLGHVAVVPVTGTSGPDETHVVLTPETGLTRYDQSYADVTAVQPVDRTRLLARRGLLTRREMASIEHRLAAHLVL